MRRLLLVLLTVVSGICYRLGGSWETKWRDFGCSAFTLLSYCIFGLWCKSGIVNIIIYLLCFGALFGTLTTYWKKKGEPARWNNWFMHGFMNGITAIPLLAVGISWYAICIRAVVLGLTTMAVSELSNDVFVEEFFRGALIIATVPILVI